MPNSLPKYLGIFFLLMGLCRPLSAQSLEKQLFTADSLFEETAYEQALDGYQTLYDRYRYYTPRMLLRAGLAEEALSRPSQALYWFNLYYIENPDRLVKDHIQALAREQSYQGYEFGELDYAQYLYNRYYLYICGTLLGAFGLMFLTLLWRRWQRKPLMYVPFFFLGFAVASALAINFDRLYQRGIVTAEANWLMEGPSPGAHRALVLGLGHRVLILDHVDGWYKIAWQGQNLFINDQNVKVLEN